jgi:uncharacterized protein
MRRRSKKNISASKKRSVKRALLRVSRKPPKPLQKKKKTPSRKMARKVNPRILAPAFAAQKETPPLPQATWEDRRIPAHYWENRLVLLVRDPWWLYAYWEVTPERQREVAAEVDKSGRGPYRTVLRVYDVTGGMVLPRSNSFFDIELNFQTDNWYIDVGTPNREWMAEIGFRDEKGRFFALVRSNRVRTPAFGISDVLDEEWMLPEEIYFRLIGRSLGSSASGNSMDIRRLLEKYLKNVVSSENSPEISRKAL